MPSPGWESTLVDRATLRAFAAASFDEQDRQPLDEPTWEDLDLDAVAARLDRTASLPGRMVLFRILRAPSRSMSVLAERERLIGLFETDQALATELREELVRVDRKVGAEEIVALLWGEPPEPLPLSWAYPLLALAAALTLAAAVTIGNGWVVALIVVVAVNGATYFGIRMRCHGELEALRFVAALLAAARRIALLKSEGLGQRTAATRRRGAQDEATDPSDRVAFVQPPARPDLRLPQYGFPARAPGVRAHPGPLCLRCGRCLRELFLGLGELDVCGESRAGVASTAAGAGPSCTTDRRLSRSRTGRTRS